MPHAAPPLSLATVPKLADYLGDAVVREVLGARHWGQIVTVATTINDKLASISGASYTSRALVLIPAGTYTEEIDLTAYPYVDLWGEGPTTILTSASTLTDTVECGAMDTLIGNLTLRHTGNDQYALHADRASDPEIVHARLLFVDVDFVNTGNHPAVGVGLHGDQQVEFYRCTMTAAGSLACNFHNGADPQSAPSHALFYECEVTSTTGTALGITAFASGQPDTLYVIGGRYTGATFGIASSGEAIYVHISDGATVSAEDFEFPAQRVTLPPYTSPLIDRLDRRCHLTGTAGRPLTHTGNGLGPTVNDRLSWTGDQPSSVSTSTGTIGPATLSVTGAVGGNTTIATTGTGGAGSALSTTAGAGGQATAATTASTGGVGGSNSVLGGAGGAATVSGSGTNTGGNGGAVNVTAGAGGAASGGATNAAGTGGALTCEAGQGGAGTSGGTGGAALFRGGAAGATAGASGGAATLQGGGGSGTGSGGSGGAVSVLGGSAGGDNTANRSGGGITVTAGTSKGSAEGGAIALNGGTGGPGTGTAGAAGGPVTIRAGAGGVGSSTSGNGGLLSLFGGAAGAGTSPGNGGAAELRGGAAAPVAGSLGGAVGIYGANGTSTGSGGVGGAADVRAGDAAGDNTANRSGGAVTVRGGSAKGAGTGGGIHMTAGTGGPGTAAVGGEGGRIDIIAGAGGNNATAGGVGGNVNIRAGLPGTGGTVAGGSIICQTGRSALATCLTMDDLGNVVVGNAALATTATAGFLYIPTCAGVPTGVPTAFTGRVPMVYDSTNDKLYLYRSGWKVQPDAYA